MDMSKEALNFLMESGINPEDRVVKLDDVNGIDRTFIINAEGSGREITPAVHHRAKDRLEVHTLNGLCEYIESQRERENVPLFIQVEDEQTVRVLGVLDEEGQREELAVAKAIVPHFNYDQFMDTERLIISLQSKFVKTQDSKIILQVVGNVREENVRSTGDDGISQVVKVKQGITSVGDVKVPNPVSLAPYRTFLEVEQPESKFIFRMKEGPTGAIFEADGGFWRNDAIRNIANYLTERLIDKTDVVGEEPYNITIIA